VRKVGGEEECVEKVAKDLGILRTPKLNPAAFSGTYGRSDAGKHFYDKAVIHPIDVQDAKVQMPTKPGVGSLRGRPCIT